MDSNVIIGFPNRIDDAVVTGGAWLEPMPLANLQDRLLSRVARSLDVDTSSTTFTIDLGRQRNIRILALIAHTISFSGRLRVRASNASDFSTTVYDATGDVWTTVAGADWDIEALEWEQDIYWAGTFTQDEIEGQTAVASRILAEPVQARYWRFDIDDAGNDAGYIDIGRVFIGDAFLQPAINMKFGASLGYEADTVVEKSLGGVDFFDPREPLRVMRFSLGFLSDAEGFGKALELTRRAGVHKEVFVVANALDATYGPQRNFLGRLRQLSALEQVMHNYNSMSFEIKELR